MERLKLTEIFMSLQGESQTVGLPTVFIRLTGCPLRCQYCDTEYAFKGGEWHNLDAIVKQTIGYGVQHVTVTGGEPLAQKPCRNLMAALCNEGLSVSLETCGAMSIADIDERVTVVMDLKTPGPAEVSKNDYDNIALLKPNDEVKFVICSREDYDWAKSIIVEHHLAKVCQLLFSPSQGQVDATALAEWIIEDRLPVRFQLQLHKILWGDQPGK